MTTKKGFNERFDVEGTFVKKPFDNDIIISAEKQLAAGKSKLLFTMQIVFQREKAGKYVCLRITL